MSAHGHSYKGDRDAISHSNAGQEASASLVYPPGSVPLFLPSTLFPSRHPPLLRSRSLSKPRKETRNKNNKKCFLPFRLYISHLALSSLSQSLILYPILLVTFKSHSPYPFFIFLISIKFSPSFKQFLTKSLVYLSTVLNLNFRHYFLTIFTYLHYDISKTSN